MRVPSTQVALRRLSGVSTVLAVTALVASCSSADKSTVSDAGAATGDATTPLPDAARRKDAAAMVEAGCGARGETLCGQGAKCASAADCTSALCTGGVCTAPPPSCTDGTKDGMESDVDCGGSMCPLCGTGKTCGGAADCASDVCVGGTCRAASKADGVKNDSETDTDCGGALLASGAANAQSDGAPPCAVGKTCAYASDCTEGVCSAAADGGKTLSCQAASPTDTVKNDSETDVDCGGGFLAGGAANPASDGAPVCTLGKSCTLGTDCFAGVCNANNNAGGGPIDCPAGATCACQDPWDDDGVKNGGETDVDCGGATAPGTDGAPPCAPGQVCDVAADCQSGVCKMGVCAMPSPTDGIQNDSETDVDCGGKLLADGTANPASDQAPACADAKHCAIDQDCLSLVCSLVTLTCVDAPSCKGLVPPATIMDVTTPAGTTPGSADAVGTPDPNGAGQHAGLDTCGQGESTDLPQTQTHESCCKSLPVTIAGKALRYDKYEVTAGRMRQFLESLTPPYDVRGWALAQFDASFNPTTPIGTTLAAELPIKQAGVTTNVLDLLPKSATTSQPLNAVIQTGAVVMDATGSQGCYTAEGAFGASTYWWSSTTLDDQGSSPPRPFTQDYYDIKPINCIPSWLGAAFCAWDGGRLPLETEHLFVWQGGTGGTNKYPWGDTFLPNPYPGTGVVGYPNNRLLTGAAYQPATAHTVDWYNSNLGSATNPIAGFYFYPSSPLSDRLGTPDSVNSGLDFSPLIAAPGRFFLDRTSLTGGGDAWQDLGADMIEMSQMASFTGASSFCDQSGTLGAGEAFNCLCPGNNCSAASCGGNGVHCGVTRATNFPTYNILGGSWEGHAVKETLVGGYPIYRQYGKLGLRCIRPAEGP